MDRLPILTAELERRDRANLVAQTAISLVRAAGRPAEARAIAQECASAGVFSPRTAGVLEHARRDIRLAAVGDTGSDVSDADRQAWEQASTTFLAAVRAQSVVGRLTQARRISSFNRSAVETVSGAGAAWVAPGAAIPLSRSEFENAALTAKKVGAMLVMPREFSTSPLAQANLTAELARALADRVDRTFCSADSADSAKPAGIRENAVTVTSSGTSAAQYAADLASMVAAQADGGCDVTSSVWIIPPRLAALFRLMRVADDAGTLAGLPTLTSTATLTLILLATAHLLIAERDALQLGTSAAGLVEMSDGPQGNTITPTGVSATPVALFAADAVALRAIMAVNWEVRGPATTDGQHAVVELV